MPVDRSRRFDLPGIQDLNKDQDEALARPLDGQHLIIGGPGTGKSVVALLRARRLAAEDKNYLILVYNHLLNGSNRKLFGSTQSLDSNTWEGWFWRMYRSIFNRSVPTIQQENQKAFQPVDWDAISEASKTLNDNELPFNDSHFLLLDEGQDMPPQFYSTLKDWGLENFYVVADQNQQLQPDKCSSRQDIENALAVNTADTLELKANYRNTRPVAQLAHHFYPANPASPRPDLPALAPSASTPELWTYGGPGQPSLNEVIGQILQMSDRFPSKLIGIITPDNVVRKMFCDAVDGSNPRLDNGKPPVQTFESGQGTPLDFGSGGIMIINAQSCKGLEFDIAILANIDQHQPKWDIYALKSRFYVMVARGREQVILLRTGDPCKVVESLLPIDSNLLVRKK